MSEAPGSWDSRTRILLGDSGVEKLKKAKVAIFGIGGVGGYVLEGLARSGVGSFLLVDSDEIDISNLNRQIIATRDTIGMKKVDAAKERVLSINPEASVETRCCFFLPENAAEFDFSGYDYIVDAVDTVTAKIAIILKAKEAGVRVISSMGAGNKLNPALFEIADLYETETDPLAKVMRRELKKRGVTELKVVWSREKPVNAGLPRVGPGRRATPGSVSFVPSAAGLIIAGEVVRDLTEGRTE